MQHPLAASRPEWPQEDEVAATSSASNLLGLVSRANFLPPLHHRPMESFERPKFLPNPGDKDFFRIKSQLEAAEHSNNNKFVSRNVVNDYEVKSKLLFLKRVVRFYLKKGSSFFNTGYITSNCFVHFIW